MSVPARIVEHLLSTLSISSQSAQSWAPADILGHQGALSLAVVTKIADSNPTTLF